jgi:hypothetical protein
MIGTTFSIFINRCPQNINRHCNSCLMTIVSLKLQLFDGNGISQIMQPEKQSFFQPENKQQGDYHPELCFAVPDFYSTLYIRTLYPTVLR